MSRPFQNEIQQVRPSTGSSPKKQREKAKGWRKAATHQKHAAKGEQSPNNKLLQFSAGNLFGMFNFLV